MKLCGLLQSTQCICFTKDVEKKDELMYNKNILVRHITSQYFTIRISIFVTMKVSPDSPLNKIFFIKRNSV